MIYITMKRKLYNLTIHKEAQILFYFLLSSFLYVYAYEMLKKCMNYLVFYFFNLTLYCEDFPKILKVT